MSARPRLTPHQREVFDRIERRAQKGLVSGSWLIGARGACRHLVAKGYLVEVEVRGPRGGTQWRYELPESGR